MLSDMKKIFLQAKEQFTVSDLFSSDLHILFILESPHREEIKHGAPLAGSSGRSVSKVLFGEQEDLPFGRLLKKHSEQRPYKGLGIMNVCPFPMQSEAIPSGEWVNEHSDFVKVVEKVRTSNDKDTYKQDEWNSFQEIMLADFKERLKKLSSRPLVIVPCGRFAQKQFRLAEVLSPRWSLIENVPHPSYNSWTKERYSTQIQEVKHAVESLKAGELK
ncbi:Uracil DNA glycosylase superfamily protein [Fictibacillus solisalsi]|uniref:Uracil DNA glycosylase superfamily protein n=1 Tax=Fictibacillus solisalsi TaxID=459525 RepID=A0A1G9V615_9BACL|nr:uracil-DNA glycosylase family protein [Fictibacillus solisalsi]SDM67599.1 Uracil DNA glycosylase superfamily protein [Fictibacillus solisalsi]